MKPRIKVITLGADDPVLALYPRTALAKDGKVQAARAGARITDPAGDRFWGGYSGYFQDPDGHLWEIAWNPAWDAGA